MPIRAENRARYPSDWPEISRQVREEAGQRCEWCNAPNGAMIVRGSDNQGDASLPGWRFAGSPVYDNTINACTGEPIPGANWDTFDANTSGPVKVVLTVAHLGLPAQLPLFLHVTRHAVADEVVEAICFLVPLDPEASEWRAMMHNRATAEFLRGPPAGGAGFFIAIPCGPPRRSPARAVVFRPLAASPVWVRLTEWRLTRKPSEATLVAAEPSPGLDIPSAYPEAFSAALTSGVSETSLRSAYCFTVTGARTSAPVIGRLLRSEEELAAANDAVARRRRFARSCHAALYHMDDYPENCARENLRALCQRCHNTYDAPARRLGIQQRARAEMADGDLFQGDA